MERRNIVIWLKSSQKETFTSAYHKGACYLQLADRLAARNRLFFAYDAASYRGDGYFYPAYEYRDGAIACGGKEKIKADAIYNLGNVPSEDFAAEAISISNTPAFRKFFSSKFAAYQFLPEFFPKTFFVDSEAGFFAALTNIATARAILKPNTGTGGQGVRIFEKDSFADAASRSLALDDEMKATIAGGALMQEFIDTKNGIAGICDGYHDLRIAVVNGTIALAHVRTPAPGSLVANYQQGAAIKELAREDLPAAAIALYENVSAKIAARFPVAMYTLDIGIGAAGDPLLFEINGTTAFPWPEFESKDFFIEQLAAHLEHLFR